MFVKLTLQICYSNKFFLQIFQYNCKENNKNNYIGLVVVVTVVVEWM